MWKKVKKVLEKKDPIQDVIDRNKEAEIKGKVLPQNKTGVLYKSKLKDFLENKKKK